MYSSNQTNTSDEAALPSTFLRYKDDYRDRSTRTDDPSAWMLARHWLAECRKNHKLCQKFIAKQKYPSRLIDVRSEDSDAVRLHITAEESTDGDYFTLSHCWGEEGLVTKLTVETYESMRRGIPLSKLPRTFQDAIKFARFCGVKYIWIDSLCIVQDSTLDWEAESLGMGQAYANSLCNINATSSADSSGGCFNARESDLVRPILVSLSGRWTKYTSPGLHICYPSGAWHNNVETAPLNRRAWVLQERLLAPMQLHCAKKQLFWECRELRCCETLPSSYPPYHLDSFPNIQDINSAIPNEYRQICLFSQIYYNTRVPAAMTAANNGLDRTDKVIKRFGRLGEAWLKVKKGKVKDFIQDEVQSSDPSQLEREIYQQWNSLVLAYSTCNLTYEKDKLVAIAGIADIVQEGTGDENLAGLWRKHLPYQLLWNTSGPATRLETKVAPTWSWAAWLDPITTAPETSWSSEGRALVFVDNIQLPENISRYCTSPNISLHLFGFIFKYCRNSNYRGYGELSRDGPNLQIGDRGFRVDLHEGGRTNTYVPKSEDLYFLPIVRTLMAVTGLILVCRGAQIYERVGYWRSADGQVRTLDADQHLYYSLQRRIEQHPEEMVSITLV